MSGPMFREGTIIKIFLRPFFNFHLFLNNGEKITLGAGKLPPEGLPRNIAVCTRHQMFTIDVKQ